MPRKKANVVATRDLDLISKIADRAVVLYDQHNISVDRMTVVMDLLTYHGYVQKLRLLDLLDADDSNFMHDVGGINRHLDRDAKVLTGCFSPRFSQRERA